MGTARHRGLAAPTQAANGHGARRSKGTALVELPDVASLHSALQRDRQHMGQRYVEVSAVTKAAMAAVQQASKQ